MKYLLEFLLKNYNVDRNQRPVLQEDGLEQPVNYIVLFKINAITF